MAASNAYPDDKADTVTMNENIGLDDGRQETSH